MGVIGRELGVTGRKFGARGEARGGVLDGEVVEVARGWKLFGVAK